MAADESELVSTDTESGCCGGSAAGRKGFRTGPYEDDELVFLDDDVEDSVDGELGGKAQTGGGATTAGRCGARS